MLLLKNFGYMFFSLRIFKVKNYMIVNFTIYLLLVQMHKEYITHKQ